MKLLLTAAAIVCFALPGYAGDCEGECPLAGNAPTATQGSLSGFDCENHCPLAQQANLHRSTGLEAVAISPVMRAQAAKIITTNLKKI